MTGPYTRDWLDDGLRLPSARDLISTVFRRIKLILVVASVIAVAATYILLNLPQYKGEMSVLVRKERVDPVITSNSGTADSANRGEITEEEMNTEGELLKSYDLLHKVVLQLRLQDSVHPGLFGKYQGEDIRVQKAVDTLASNLQVKLIPKTDVLSITYKSKQPSQASAVLDVLAREYIAKDLAVHGPSGELAFFEKKTSEYEQRMRESAQRATDFAHQQGLVDADAESSMALHRADEFGSNATAAGVSIHEFEQQLATLEAERKTTPARIDAGQKRIDNPELLQTMKASLLTLQNKEAEMTWRFQPDYPPLRDLQQQEQITAHAIATELRSPLREDTTDRNPVSDWVDNQIAQTRAALAAARARQSADLQALAAYQKSADHLMDESTEQHVLLSDAKVQADNYLVYAKRREEARIAQELNARGMINLVISSPPHASALPAFPFYEAVMVGLFLGLGAGLLIGFAAEYLDDRIRTPEQLEQESGVPVLATLTVAV